MPLVQGNSANRIHLDSFPLTADEIEKLPLSIQAGVLLFLGHWNQAHDIAQDLHTPEGSYWHAIIHRQEPDAWNSGYWFRKVGAHPVFLDLIETVHHRSDQTFKGRTSEFLLHGKWDSIRFIEFCEKAARVPGSSEEKLAIEIQHLEWQLLMNYCCEGTL